MIPVAQLKTLINQLAYARLLKDAKKEKVDVSGVRLPEHGLSAQLLSARIKSVFAAVFKGLEFSICKQRYRYEWRLTINALRNIWYENNTGFGEFFSNHPDIKRAQKRSGLNYVPSSKCFTAFRECSLEGCGTYLEYNTGLLKEAKKYGRFARTALEAYPEIKRQWENRQKLDVQQRYNEIAARRAKEQTAAADAQ